ncbi:MAG: hypothetical protein EOO23_02560 [Comamonadaceae bacterium]|nr:MAG: hypothetical protein EOO23_02560 [Comamonadaceae bacterium]
MRWARKPSGLAGIGFTMSLFIAGQALPNADNLPVANLAVFVASVMAVLAGAAILWRHTL